MSSEMIMVDNISKMYRLGEINTGTLSHDLNRMWNRLNRKDDPYQKIAEGNDRNTKGSSNYVWSLKDISFSVKEGEVFGILGKNGAGKSTLLKILSKITKPTKGSISLDGRVASLLEVGTGFHPDLSGRENVYLNGAILGMRKQEIRNRFDEIVDFSGIERYIDTPVKRYSSGMFVRLAFAVAAHLEPEILIIDEVLAVGDAAFQQKCMGKMRDVSQKHGRTVLFVSHNSAAIKQLCSAGILLENGETRCIDKIDKILELYQSTEKDKEQGTRGNIPLNQPGYFASWRLQVQKPSMTHHCLSGEQINIQACFESLTELHSNEFHIRIRTADDVILLHASSMDFEGYKFKLNAGQTLLSLSLYLPIKPGKYSLEFGLLSLGKWVDTWVSSTKLHVLDNFEAQAPSTHSGILQVKTKFRLEAANADVFSY